MQWLINIITELFTNRHRYFDRGDPVAFDFQIGDFIEDNTWRDLDLSGIIPANVVLVLLRVVVRSTTISTVVNFRKNGNVSVFNVVRFPIFLALIRNSLDVHVTPDANGVIEYKFNNDKSDLCNITVAGWWLE